MIVILTSMESLPDHCYECPCHNDEHGHCQADKERRYSLDYRPYWCPLKAIYGYNGMRQGGNENLQKTNKADDISSSIG